LDGAHRVLLVNSRFVAWLVIGHWSFVLCE
jgi:hypothetical protein